MIVSSLLLLLALACAVGADAVVPFKYPLFKQCDPRWGDDPMGSNGLTVCKVGCLMSSVAMALRGHNIAVSGAAADPGSLNGWLRQHDGYTSGSDLKESVVPQINPQRAMWEGSVVPVSHIGRVALHTMLDSRASVVVANVMDGGHFVLAIGYDPQDLDLLLVNDPGFQRTNYSISTDVVGWRIFTMLDK